jgi:ABC-type lipoprotein release transport system permease subunit
LLVLRIALRYLFSKKSHNAVNVISVISIAGVAVATAAIIVVMSVFNGFADLASSHLSQLDPELKAVPASGKVIAGADSLCARINRLDGVDTAMPSLTERGLLVCGQSQLPVVFMGVTEAYSRITNIDSVMVDGTFTAEPYYTWPVIQLSAGVAVHTGLHPDLDTAVSLYVPRRKGKINPANPAAAFNGDETLVSGVFQVNQSEYDVDHIIVPLDLARRLLDYTDEASAIEIKLKDGASADNVIAEILNLSNGDITVQTRLEQQSEAFKMIAVEKWVTFMMLVFILVIASFNILSTLSLLVIEKRDNMQTLRAIGASYSMVAKVFMVEGVLITLTGGIFGIILGSVLTLLQQHGGYIKLAADPATLTTDVYPVRLACGDIFIVFAAIAIVAVLASLATRLFTRKIN